MKISRTVRNIALLTAIAVTVVNADDGREFNTTPVSPLNADFFSDDIPAVYLSDTVDKTVQNYAILECGPSAELNADEIYIEHLPDTCTRTGNSIQGTYNADDLYPTAPGVFISEDKNIIPENLVCIESLPNTENRAPEDTLDQPPVRGRAGEFVSDESGGITAGTAAEDRYNALPAGTFSIGYQLRYMHYTESGATCETIYNGISAVYTHRFGDNIVLRASSSILGGAIFNRNNGTVYSDSKLLFGTEFSTADRKFSLTPYLGVGLRYMNNVFAGEDIKCRDTLQLYLPVGLNLSYNPQSNLSLYADIEVSPIAMNQNWTTGSSKSQSTTTTFNGLNALFEIGTEYRINQSLTLNISPYYQYTYTGGKSNSLAGSSSTHMVGINAGIQF